MNKQFNRMKKYLLILFFLLLCGTTALYAQQDTKFWFAAPYFNCSHGETSPYRMVIFAFEEDATVTISMPANPSFTPIVQNVPKGGYANIQMASNKAAGDATITTPFNQITDRGLFVSSTSKIECYFQVDGDNSEAFTLKGRNALGTNFLITGQKSFNNGSGGSFEGSRHSFHIVASENNTVVTINPSAAILKADGTAGIGPITVTLQKGQTYAVAAYSQNATDNLVGTTITSTKPIAVTSNDDSVYTNGSADTVGEQIVPTDFAGTDFVIVCGGGYYEYCTIFAMHDNTTVTTSQGDSFSMNKGDYEVVSMYGRNAMRIESDLPIMVFQVLTSSGSSGELGGTVVPQVHCTGSNIAGYKTFSSGMSVSINLITEKKNISHFLLNGTAISASSFHPVDATEEYYYARLQRTASSDASYVVECTSGFFQMGVSEGDYSGSSTYGFFSNYGAYYLSEVEAVFLENSVYTWENHFRPGETTPMTFTVPGEYRDTIPAADGCDSICILHLQSTGCVPLETRPDTIVHTGASVPMWATGSDYITWSPTTYLSTTADGDLYANPVNTITYTVSSYKKGLLGSNLVENGDFDAANTGFTTSLSYFAPYTTIGGFGTYTISEDVKGFWQNHVSSHLAYGGTGNMMIVDGKTTPNSTVWSQQVDVEPNTYYAFSAQVMSCWDSNKQGHFALLQFSVNGEQLGDIFHSPTALYEWSRYYEVWYSGNNTTAQLTILNQNSDGYGNDFAIDEIIFEPLNILCDTRTVKITVFESVDTTRFADAVCADELPYTHPETGLVFPEGTVSGTKLTKTLTNQYGSDSVLLVELFVLPTPNLVVRPDTVIGPGDTVQLWATGADYYEWSPAEGLIQTADNKIYASPTETTTYTVTGYSTNSSGKSNLVINGDFEEGNKDFTSDMYYRLGFKPTGTSGEYTINDAVNKFWESSSAPDAATAPAYGGSGLMMIVDGANWANAVVWQQQVTVTPHTYYTFSAQVMSCLASNKHGKYALLQFSVNGDQLGEIFHSPTVLYDWSRYYEVWYSGESTTATLTIYNQNTDHNGNDFAIDDIRFEPLNSGCASTASVTIVYYCEPVQGSFQVPTVCADAPTLPIELTLTAGEISEYSVHFTNAARNTMPFRDTTITVTRQRASASPIILDVPMPADPTDRSRYPRPDDTYTVSLSVSDICGNTLQLDAQPFTVLYPSWITEQHWDDVISLVNDTYNGGYTFSHVAWLRDGVELEGENNYYIYLPHDLWTDETHTTHATYQYQALLTRTDDGKTFLTCPMEPTPIDKTDMMDGNNPYVDVTPRLVPKESPVVELSTNTVGTYWLYDMAGSLVQTGTYAPCVHAKLDLRVPDIRSMYVLVFTPTGVKKPLDEKYRVIRIIVE